MDLQKLENFWPEPQVVNRERIAKERGLQRACSRRAQNEMRSILSWATTGREMSYSAEPSFGIQLFLAKPTKLRPFNAKE